MNSLESYEFVAEAFRVHTGFMAPGKDAGFDNSHTQEERQEAWKKWHDENKKIIRAFELAGDRILLGNP